MDEVDQEDEEYTRAPIVTEISAKSQRDTLDRKMEDQEGIYRCRKDFIQNIQKLVGRIQKTTDGLASTTKAQYYHVQNLVEKKEMSVKKDKERGWLHVHVPSFSFGYKGSAKETELRPEDLNENEKETLASLQDVMSNFVSTINSHLSELQSALESELASSLDSVIEPNQTTKDYFSADMATHKNFKISSRQDNDPRKKDVETSVDVEYILEQTNSSVQKLYSDGKYVGKVPKDKKEFIKEIVKLHGIFVEKQGLYDHLQEKYELLQSKETDVKEELIQKSKELSKMKEKNDKMIAENAHLLEEKTKNEITQKEFCSNNKKEVDRLVQELSENKQKYDALKTLQEENIRDLQNASNEIAVLEGKRIDLQNDIENKSCEIKSISNNLDQKENAIIKLQTEIAKRNIKQQELETRLSKEIEDLRATVRENKEKLQESYRNNEALEKEYENMKIDIQAKDSCIQSLEKANKSNTLELQRTKSIVKTLESTVNEKGLDLQRKDSVIEDLRGKMEDGEKELKRKEMEIKASKGKLDAIEREVMEMQSDLNAKALKIEALGTKLNDNHDELKKVTKENERLEKAFTDKVCKIDELKRINSNLEKEQSSLQTALNMSQTQNKAKDEELAYLRKWKEEYDEEQEKKRMHRKAILYIPRRGDLVNMVVSDLRVRLVSLFEEAQSGLDFEEVDNVSRIKPNTPVLVFCINASRLGTDVSNALNGVRVSSHVAVIVLHHKEQHALPNQSSERVLTSTEYKSLGGIFDMACLSSKGGIYECDMNSNAIRALFDFIKQRNVQQ